MGSFNITQRPEWKGGQHMLEYMLTRKSDPKVSDTGMPRRRSQQEWESVFAASERVKDHASDNEAAWRAAIKDAQDQASDVSHKYQQVVLLLRQATASEVADRREWLLDLRDRIEALLFRHIRVKAAFNDREDRLKKGRLESLVSYAQTWNPARVISPSYENVLNFAIPNDMWSVDKELKLFMEPELKPRGRRVMSLAPNFNARLQELTSRVDDVQENVVCVEDINEFLESAEAPFLLWEADPEKAIVADADVDY